MSKITIDIDGHGTEFYMEEELSPLEAKDIIRQHFAREKLFRSFDEGKEVELSTIMPTDNGCVVCDWNKLEDRYQINLFHPDRFRICDS